MSRVALVFWIAMASFVLAIPLLYWASGRYPPGWRWLWAYVGAMTTAAVVVTLTAGGLGTA